MNKKLYLEAPQAELIVVRFEDNILSDPLTTNGSTFEENADVDDHSGENWW